jgi:very-short-patch-repair endonuclease
MCPIHGEFEQIVNNHLQGHGCPVCNESRGEVKILKFLTENNINFIRQKKFKECKNIKLLSFDFYLPEYNMCIEFDGEQHFRTVNEWGGENSYVNIKKNDDIKNDFCDKNSIELIRINYKENINDILKNKIKI